MREYSRGKPEDRKMILLADGRAGGSRGGGRRPLPSPRPARPVVGQEDLNLRAARGDK